MSKGWESKNVEEQQAQALSATPLEGRGAEAAKVRDHADRQRRIQGLELQRERVLSEQTSSPHRRSALQAALDSIELELQTLGWSVKL